jgi:hypothetical protein
VIGYGATERVKIDKKKRKWVKELEELYSSGKSQS